MNDDITWSPRLRQSLLWQLYRSEAAGATDEHLLNEVGSILYHRCCDIIVVDHAVAGMVRCPRCRLREQESVIHRETHDPKAILSCNVCQWQMTWDQYRKSFQRKQLNLGGAGPAFKSFVDQWPCAKSNQQKMLLVDRLIHEFHYSLRAQPNLPTRPACVNLIEGNLTNVVAFLERLSEGQTNSEFIQNFNTWKLNHKRNLDHWFAQRPR